MKKIFFSYISLICLYSSFVNSLSLIQIEEQYFSANLEARLNAYIEKTLGEGAHLLSVEVKFVAEPTDVTEKIDVSGRGPVEIIGETSGYPTAQESSVENTVFPPSIENDLMIDFIETTLLLDNSISKEKELLLHTLLIQDLSFNAARGDKIEIIRSSLIPVPQQDSNLNHTQLSHPEQWFTWKEGGGLILLFSMLFILRHSQKKNSKQVRTQLNDVPLVTALSLHKEYLVSEQLQTLVQLGLSDPDKVREGGEKLSLDTQYIPLVASCYQVLEHTLFMSMFPTLIPKIPYYIKSLADHPTNDDRLIADLTEVIKLLMDASAFENYTPPIAAFSFLETLSKNQLFWLLDNEPLAIQVILLAKLPSECTQDLLAMFDAKVQIKISKELMGAKAVDAVSTQRIEETLLEKVKFIPNFEAVTVNSYQMLINTLDQMTIPQQMELLTGLKQTSPDAYNALREIYYLFDDLHRTSPAIIHHVLNELDSKVLALALAEMTHVELDHILFKFPAPVVLQIKQEIKILVDEDGMEKASSKQIVLDLMRTALADKYFMMSELSHFK